MPRMPRVSYGGPLPGPRPGGKKSSEIAGRWESCLESVRNPKAINPKDRPRKFRIVRGDRVQVIDGKDTGVQGRVIEVLRKSNQLLIEGVNFINHYTTGGDGSRIVIRTEAPIPYSNAQIVCPETGLPTKINMKFLEDGTKVRVAKRSGAIIPRPDILRKRRIPIPPLGPKDTDPKVVLRKTFDDSEGLVSLAKDLKRPILVPPNVIQSVSPPKDNQS